MAKKDAPKETPKEVQKVSERPVAPKNIKVEDALAKNKVKMRFNENKFYNDLDVPYFEKDKTYELEGADWIQRWLKRGGIIVEGELELPESTSNPSAIASQEEPVAEAEKTEKA